MAKRKQKSEAKNLDKAVTPIRLLRTYNKVGRDESGSGGANSLQSQETPENTLIDVFHFCRIFHAVKES